MIKGLDLRQQDSSAPYEEKNRVLFARQMDTLHKFRDRKAISQLQFEKSVEELCVNFQFGK